MNILEFFGSMPSSYVDYLHIFNGMKSEKSTIKGSCTTYHGLNVYFFWMSAGPIEASRQCKLQWRNFFSLKNYWSNRAPHFILLHYLCTFSPFCGSPERYILKQAKASHTQEWLNAIILLLWMNPKAVYWSPRNQFLKEN